MVPTLLNTRLEGAQMTEPGRAVQAVSVAPAFWKETLTEHALAETFSDCFAARGTKRIFPTALGIWLLILVAADVEHYLKDPC